MEKLLPQNQFKYILLLFLVPLFWGGAFATAHHAVTEIPPFTIAAIRFGIAGLLLLIWLLIRKQWNWTVLKKRWLGLLIMSLTGVFAYNAFFFLGLQYTSATNGALVIATSPVFITLVSVIFLKETMTKRKYAGMILSLFGVIIVISKGSFMTLLSLTFNQGDLLLLVSMLSWVIYGTVGKIVLKGVSPLLATTTTTIMGSLLLVVGSLFEGGWTTVPTMSFQVGLEILYMIIFATVLGFVFWNIGIHHVGPSRSSAFLNFVPVNAMWISALIYNANIEWPQIAGMLLVISGVYLTTIKRRESIILNHTREKALKF